MKERRFGAPFWTHTLERRSRENEQRGSPLTLYWRAGCQQRIDEHIKFLPVRRGAGIDMLLVMGVVSVDSIDLGTRGQAGSFYMHWDCINFSNQKQLSSWSNEMASNSKHIDAGARRHYSVLLQKLENTLPRLIEALRSTKVDIPLNSKLGRNEHVTHGYIEKRMNHSIHYNCHFLPQVLIWRRHLPFSRPSGKSGSLNEESTSVDKNVQHTSALIKFLQHLHWYGWKWLLLKKAGNT